MSSTVVDLIVKELSVRPTVICKLRVLQTMLLRLSGYLELDAPNKLLREFGSEDLVRFKGIQVIIESGKWQNDCTCHFIIASVKDETVRFKVLSLLVIARYDLGFVATSGFFDGDSHGMVRNMIVESPYFKPNTINIDHLVSKIEGKECEDQMGLLDAKLPLLDYKMNVDVATNFLRWLEKQHLDPAAGVRLLVKHDKLWKDKSCHPILRFVLNETDKMLTLSTMVELGYAFDLDDTPRQFLSSKDKQQVTAVINHPVKCCTKEMEMVQCGNPKDVCEAKSTS